MRNLIAAALTASLLALPVAEPAAAFPVDTAPASASGSLGTDVAFRHFGGVHRGGFHARGVRPGGFGGHRLGGLGAHRVGGFGGRRFGGYHRGFGGRRFYGGRRVGAGIAGLAAGAIIGSVIAGEARANNAVADCERRFKSYTPASGTYLGYDGLRHRCP